jgi:hypothetical protein
VNPAARLADVLEGWTVPRGSTPLDHRGGPGDDGYLSTWRRIAAAAELLQQVERALDGLEAAGDDVSTCRTYVPLWYRAVFSADQALMANTTNQHVPID